MDTQKDKATHKHEFKLPRKQSTVEVCRCGNFRFTELSGEPIVAIEAITHATK